jgi:hypothetical protein
LQNFVRRIIFWKQTYVNVINILIYICIECNHIFIFVVGKPHCFFFFFFYQKNCWNDCHLNNLQIACYICTNTKVIIIFAVVYLQALKIFLNKHQVNPFLSSVYLEDTYVSWNIKLYIYLIWKKNLRYYYIVLPWNEINRDHYTGRARRTRNNVLL